MKPGHLYYILLCLVTAIALDSCQSKEAKTLSEEKPDIFPDYTDVTVPPNIAPLNFEAKGATSIQARFTSASGKTFLVSGKSAIQIPQNKWKSLLKEAAGKTIKVDVSVWSAEHPEGIRYKTFGITVSKDSITPWIAYRLIPPGYEGWHQMGIYERELSSFKVRSIIENTQNNNGCVNCHSFSNYSPKKLMFHARGKNGGTIVVNDGKIEKLSLEKIPPYKGASYCYWHPSGRFIAFSSNDTRQSFYGYSKNKIEVYDTQSDLLIYDVAKKRFVTDERFSDSIHYETYPAFSPDGKYLYFCTSPGAKLPMEIEKLHYSIVRVPFLEDGTLGTPIDTLYHASRSGGSAHFPRISPDGQYLMYTWTLCGTFPIHHKEADLKMVDLKTRKEVSTIKINSGDVESYHSWSNNGKWIIFSSKRIDSRYTRIFIVHWDGKNFGKPFLLPQKHPEDNTTLLFSYNIPEFIQAPAVLPKDNLARIFQ